MGRSTCTVVPSASSVTFASAVFAVESSRRLGLVVHAVLKLVGEGDAEGGGEVVGGGGVRHRLETSVGGLVQHPGVVRVEPDGFEREIHADVVGVFLERVTAAELHAVRELEVAHTHVGGWIDLHVVVLVTGLTERRALPVERAHLGGRGEELVHEGGGDAGIAHHRDHVAHPVCVYPGGDAGERAKGVVRGGDFVETSGHHRVDARGVGAVKLAAGLDVELDVLA